MQGADVQAPVQEVELDQVQGQGAQVIERPPPPPRPPRTRCETTTARASLGQGWIRHHGTYDGQARTRITGASTVMKYETRHNEEKNYRRRSRGGTRTRPRLLFNVFFFLLIFLWFGCGSHRRHRPRGALCLGVDGSIFGVASSWSFSAFILSLKHGS